MSRARCLFSFCRLAYQSGLGWAFWRVKRRVGTNGRMSQGIKTRRAGWPYLMLVVMDRGRAARETKYKTEKIRRSKPSRRRSHYDHDQSVERLADPCQAALAPILTREGRHADVGHGSTAPGFCRTSPGQSPTFCLSSGLDARVQGDFGSSERVMGGYS